MTVEEYLNSIKPTDGSVGGFNKKQFSEFMSVLLNDETYITKIARGCSDGYKEKEINPSKEFRKFIRKILTKLSMDKNDSKVILDYDFTIDDCDGLYEFFTTAMYEFMNKGGHRFELPTKKDFKGYLYLNNIEAYSKEYTAKNPQNGEIIGTFKADIDDHKILKSKSTCPRWLNKKVPTTKGGK